MRRIYSVEPGTPSYDAMRLLATWAATQDAEAAHTDDARRRGPRVADGLIGALRLGGGNIGVPL